jgi:thiol-disulfide isomerase/thioredoxin
MLINMISTIFHRSAARRLLLSTTLLTAPLWAQDPAPEPPKASEAAPQEKLLGAGDPAPALKVGKWLQGEAVPALERNKAYVVEFWATWCGPCRTTIPHLNKLHQKFAEKGMIFIGQNCFEDDEPAVQEFVKKMGDAMSYRIALDDTSVEGGVMAQTWMAAAGQYGIPCAFVVGKDGNVLWIGHPAKLTETMLDEVVAGTFDPKAAAEAARAAKEAAADDSVKLGLMHLQLGNALKSEKWEEAATALQMLEKALPEEEKASFDLTKLQICLGLGKTEESLELGKALTEKFSTDALRLQQVAQLLAKNAQGSTSMLELAENTANKAWEIAPEPGKPLMQHLKATIKAKLGQKAEARKILEELQKQAPERLKPRIQATLDSLK